MNGTHLTLSVLSLEVERVWLVNRLCNIKKSMICNASNSDEHHFKFSMISKIFELFCCSLVMMQENGFWCSLYPPTHHIFLSSTYQNTYLVFFQGGGSPIPPALVYPFLILSIINRINNGQLRGAEMDIIKEKSKQK